MRGEGRIVFLIMMILPMFLVGVFIVFYFVVLVPNAEEKINNSTCDELLSSIKTTTPNYQYDVREWISKECWK